MSKKICKLEKETTSWKTRWERSHQALLEMAADKQQRDEEMVKAARQMAQLQRLCRTLQEQRTKYMTRLKECK
jgi:murein endopeptidase